jgi:hypothetical protein
MAYIVVFLMSLVEWLLATSRICAIQRGDRLKAAGIVFMEEVLGFLVLYIAVTEQNLLLILCSALGGAIGLLVSMGRK